MNVGTPRKPKKIQWVIRALSRPEIRRIEEGVSRSREVQQGRNASPDLRYQTSLRIVVEGTVSPPLNAVAVGIGIVSGIEFLEESLKMKSGLIELLPARSTAFRLRPDRRERRDGGEGGGKLSGRGCGAGCCTWPGDMVVRTRIGCITRSALTIGLGHADAERCLRVGETGANMIYAFAEFARRGDDRPIWSRRRPARYRRPARGGWASGRDRPWRVQVMDRPRRR